jgi:hypothetical protein
MSTEHRSAASAARHGIMNGAVLAFAVVTGCAVGPDYRAPELTVPARYSESGVHASVGTSLAEWWRVFHDAPLDRLVERAIDANLDLRIAEAQVRESRALRGIARSALWPTVDGSAAYSRTRQSENRPLGGAVRRGLVPLETDLYEAALDASWEIDIFGGTRRAVESAEAEINAADEARRDVLVIPCWARSDRATSSCAGCRRSLPLPRPISEPRNRPSPSRAIACRLDSRRSWTRRAHRRRSRPPGPRSRASRVPSSAPCIA